MWDCPECNSENIYFDLRGEKGKKKDAFLVCEDCGYEMWHSRGLFGAPEEGQDHER